ncbi:hypothetical protein EVG20_g8637 [Dentipellis fragilis]|uniref:GPI mannosyltransferase 1 n=1 Tax=Dentipellis fragilis TaxID=205917 RepID=A0A4Y9Y8P5_9AGAM|nr:hypothetical protein EVG20_g8637 [Dentipellis fragilis]
MQCHVRTQQTATNWRAWTVLVASALLRVALILYSEWHDAHSVVKYTDVDYRVFSDATRFTLNPGPGNRAQGPLGKWVNIGDPYTRETYRYTPLLALLLAPNEWIHGSFGKYLFAGCDILAGVLMHKLLVSPMTHPPKVPERRSPKAQCADGSDPADNARNRPAADAEAIARRATILASVHLLDPFVFSISTRGSSESVLLLLVLLTLFCALRGRWAATALLLGLSTHWKIYPVIYGAACVGVIGSEGDSGVEIEQDQGRWTAARRYFKTIVNARTAQFALLSAGTFFALGAAIWGHPFLYETYLYHLHRLDYRHNFSPYFYQIYLTYPGAGISASASGLPLWRRVVRSPFASFAPQMALALGAGLLFGRKRENLVFAWFVQTAAFVLFNKYFLWYLVFIPLLIPRLSITPLRGLLYLAIWFGVQALWLSQAYKLEFLGEPVFERLDPFGLRFSPALGRSSRVFLDTRMSNVVHQNTDLFIRPSAPSRTSMTFPTSACMRASMQWSGEHYRSLIYGRVLTVVWKSRNALAWRVSMPISHDVGAQFMRTRGKDLLMRWAHGASAVLTLCEILWGDVVILLVLFHYKQLLVDLDDEGSMAGTAAGKPEFAEGVFDVLGYIDGMRLEGGSAGLGGSSGGTCHGGQERDAIR